MKGQMDREKSAAWEWMDSSRAPGAVFQDWWHLLSWFQGLGQEKETPPAGLGVVGVRSAGAPRSCVPGVRGTAVCFSSEAFPCGSLCAARMGGGGAGAGLGGLQ